MANYKEMEILLKALGSKRRLSIINYVEKNSDCTASDIADEIRLSLKSTSKHLAVLAKAGILEREQKGMYAQYALASTVPDMARTIIARL